MTRLPVIDTSPFVEQRGLDERRAVAIGHSFFDLPLADKMILHSNSNPGKTRLSRNGRPQSGG